MVILFSPSEGKHSTFTLDSSTTLSFSSFSFLGKDQNYRKRVIQNYIDAITSQDEGLIYNLFGTKQIDLDTLALSQNLFNTPCISAIRLYNGVAYEALAFERQDESVKQIILDTTIIFSNLFGPIKAHDLIPFYRLKQGSFVGNLKQYYANFTDELNEYCNQKIIIDLRAEFYQKLYKPSTTVYRPSFYKNNKRVSHYAKAYRGEFLKQIAKHQSHAQASLDLLSINFQGLKQRNIKEQKNIIHIEYDICT